MFGNMGNMANMMKQAQQMQQRITEMQQRINDTEFAGQAGAGMVKVTMTGKGVAKSVKIDPSVIDATDPEMLEDLVLAAINDTRAKIDAFSEEESAKAMGGMKLPPGMKLPF